jgi:LmbE family N-acetylglucosaminyl deacetylase
MEVKHLFRRIQSKLHWIGKYELPSWICLLQYYWLLSVGSKPMMMSQKSALIVAPHQDDETLGCGGLIALKREQGISVQVVFVTDGAASHTWHPRFKAGEIAPIRKQEALTALAILGVEQTQIHFLDKRDGKLKYAPDVERQQTIDQLAQILCDFDPGEVYVTHQQDRSADHEATYGLVKAAIAASELEVELLQYPIWLIWKTLLFREVKLSQIAGSYRLSIKAVHGKKRQAIEAYRSQYSQIEGAGGTVLPPGFLRRFFQPYEVFFKVDR